MDDHATGLGDLQKSAQKLAPRSNSRQQTEGRGNSYFGILGSAQVGPFSNGNTDAEIQFSFPPAV